MTRFTDWLKSAWGTVTNVAGKVGGFIGKAAPIVRNIGNFMSYLPGNVGNLCQGIISVAGAVDSFTGMLPSGIKNKIEQYTGKCSTSSNMNSINNIINRRGGRNITSAIARTVGNNNGKIISGG
jgi:phage-related protein